MTPLYKEVKEILDYELCSQWTEEDYEQLPMSRRMDIKKKIENVVTRHITSHNMPRPNFTTTSEIINYLNPFAGKTASQINPVMVAKYATTAAARRKGAMGWFVETMLGISPNSDARADFGELGELKVIPMKVAGDGYMMPKERMVLSMINYAELLNRPLMETHVYDKIKKTIIVLYLHDKANFGNNKILKTFLWEPTLGTMKPDFKIMQDKSHIDRISEGDCAFLASCPKHGGGWDRNNPELSKPRSKSKHPIQGFVEKRAYCIKRDVIGQIITACTGINPSKKDWFTLDAFN